MTREQYIQLRKTNNFILLAYNQYYEKMVEKSATPMDFSIFAEWFPRYVGAQHIIDSLLDHYDSLFEIVLVQRTNVQLIVLTLKRITLLCINHRESTLSRD